MPASPARVSDAGPSAWSPTKRRTTASSASRPTIAPWTGFTKPPPRVGDTDPQSNAPGETLSQLGEPAAVKPLPQAGRRLGTAEGGHGRTAEEVIDQCGMA